MTSVEQHFWSFWCKGEKQNMSKLAEFQNKMGFALGCPVLVWRSTGHLKILTSRPEDGFDAQEFFAVGAAQKI